MEEAMHFLDELKDKYLHQVEQAIEDWDYQDFSPDKRYPLLANEEEHNVRDDPGKNYTISSSSKPVRKSWIGLTPTAELENFDCELNVPGYETKLIAMCTPPGGIQGIPDAANVQRFLTHIARLDASSLIAAFTARLQDDNVLNSWQVCAKTIVLMLMLVEIKQLAVCYIPAFLANAALLRQLDALRMGTHKQVIREGARKLLSLIRSNGTNPALIPKEVTTTNLHVRHVKLGGNKQKKTVVKPAQIQQQPSKLVNSPGKVAVNKVFRPELVMPKNTAVFIQEPRSSLVLSPKVSQAVQASWRRRKSVSEDEDDKLPIAQWPAARTESRHFEISSAPGQVRQSSSTLRLDNSRASVFSFVQ